MGAALIAALAVGAMWFGRPAAIVITPRPPLAPTTRRAHSPLGDPDLMEVEIESRSEDVPVSYPLIRKSDWNNRPATVKSDKHATSKTVR
jgi:hypothetical protein